MSEVADLAGLRRLYDEPRGRAVTKQLSRIDRHCRRFIELSPFLVMATGRLEGPFDASPRGGGPGFVQVRHEGTLLLPDSPGNNRLDSMQNLVACPHGGLLFMIPASSHVDRSVLPTTGEILREQTGTEAPAETREAMRERYRKDL